MDGENNGKPYFLMDDLGVPLFSETPIYGFWAEFWGEYRFYYIAPFFGAFGHDRNQARFIPYSPWN